MRRLWMMVLALGALCGPALGSPLSGKTFETVRIGTADVATQKAPSLSVGQGRATGTGGCNQFGTTVRDLGRLEREVQRGRAQTIVKGGLRFGPVSSTRMHCGPGSAQEARFFSVLGDVRAYRMGRSELRLYSGGVRPRLLMVLRRTD